MLLVRRPRLGHGGRNVEALEGRVQALADHKLFVLLLQEVGERTGNALRQAHLRYFLVLDVAAQGDDVHKLLGIYLIAITLALLRRDESTLDVELREVRVHVGHGDAGDIGHRVHDYVLGEPTVDALRDKLLHSHERVGGLRVGRRTLHLEGLLQLSLPRAHDRLALGLLLDALEDLGEVV